MFNFIFIFLIFSIFSFFLFFFFSSFLVLPPKAANQLFISSLILSLALFFRWRVFLVLFLCFSRFLVCACVCIASVRGWLSSSSREPSRRKLRYFSYLSLFRRSKKFRHGVILKRVPGSSDVGETEIKQVPVSSDVGETRKRGEIEKIFFW